MDESLVPRELMMADDKYMVGAIHVFEFWIRYRKDKLRYFE